MAEAEYIMDSRSVSISDVWSVFSNEIGGHIARWLCVVQDVALYNGMSSENRKMTQ